MLKNDAEIIHKYANVKQNIYTNYVPKHMQNICRNYATNMQKLCNTYATYMQNICRNYANTMQHIYRNYAKQNMQNIY